MIPSPYIEVTTHPLGRQAAIRADRIVVVTEGGMIGVVVLTIDHAAGLRDVMVEGAVDSIVNKINANLYATDLP